MLEQFLLYSLSRGRAIRVIYMKDGAIAARTIKVLAISDTHITYRVGTRGKAQQMDKVDLLSAAYARGDDGSLTEGTLP
ncbi:MAG: hypothetical protein GX810_10585 [Clostridiales bacterium]|nr:hypothetical protein [Clostridiales bacterium]